MHALWGPESSSEARRDPALVEASRGQQDLPLAVQGPEHELRLRDDHEKCHAVVTLSQLLDF